MKTGPGSAALRLTVAVALVLATAGTCQGTTLPTNGCPAPPTTWMIGEGAALRVLQPSDYPPAPRAAGTSVDVSMRQLYMRHRIKASLEADVTKPLPDAGVFVGDITLRQSGQEPAVENLLDVTITPWIPSDGKPVSLQRSYSLRLRLVPYLVTPATMADESRRRALLGSTDTGVVLRFELRELFSLVNQEALSCGSANFDAIDAKVLGGIYQQLAAQDPLVVPARSVTDLISGIVGSPTNVAGVSIGSDADLKIGLALDQGSTRPFVAQAGLFSRYPTADWMVELDPSFVTTAITAQVGAQVGSIDPSAAVESVGVAFTPAGIDVAVAGRLDKCGTIRFVSNVHVAPTVRVAADGKSRVFAPTTQTQTNNANILQGACVILDQVLQSMARPLGSATAVVNSNGVCGFPMTEAIDFPVGEGDRFYATATDTDVLFTVLGRSSLMDTEVGPRPAVAACP